MSKILVIGACNIDIIGLSHKALIAGDSNPGSIKMMVGGVAKNIAENLHRLGQTVEFLTFLGGGSFAKPIRDYLDSLSIPYGESMVSQSADSGIYLACHDADGSLIAGINDVSLIESVGPAFFETKHAYLDSFDTIVLDTNLTEETLGYLLIRYAHKKLIVDGVSQSKVVRIKPYLHYIDLLKINLSELGALLGEGTDDVILGVKHLSDTGVTHAIVTNGKEPITYNIDKRIYQTLIFEPEKAVSSVGAGDALLAGVIYGIHEGKSMHESLNDGKKAAAITMEVEGACNPRLTKELLERE
ncbi:MAG: PfkB family carbohydrate kinase [Candidatus Izemoplasmatales bacterium]|nr:PfkB family carbohydrate kinase [Candidatus Izemoplasmatales bacterium]